MKKTMGYLAILVTIFMTTAAQADETKQRSAYLASVLASFNFNNDLKKLEAANGKIANLCFELGKVAGYIDAQIETYDALLKSADQDPGQHAINLERKYDLIALKERFLNEMPQASCGNVAEVTAK